jgi:aerotaxis receptor
MKKNFPITGVEVDYSSDIRIISSTDLKGSITNCNDDFRKVSGFSDEELIGKNHNVVRHPDMPPAAFADLWNTIKAGKPWMGVVKNRCKNGDHYYVDAYVTPMFENDKIVGYQSVRTKPGRQCVERANRFYQKITAGKKITSLLMGVGLQGKLIFSFLAVLVPVIAMNWFTGNHAMTFYESAIASVIAAFGLSYALSLPYRKAAEDSKDIFDNQIARKVYTGRTDELGQLLLVIKSLRSRLQTVTECIEQTSVDLSNIADQTSAITMQTKAGVHQQNREIEQVATAMNEMTATVNEVAMNAARTAESCQEANELSEDGKATLSRVTIAIHKLAENIENAANVILKLKDSSERIGSVTEVIGGIAEQTNLLALNAAIEAARAGETGRGFAVVADEVRALANRTQSSTEEIRSIIASLQGDAESASNAMKESHDKVGTSVSQATQANEALDAIVVAIQRITDMSAQIATASEEQSAVADEINSNISNIHEVSMQTSEGADAANDANNELSAMTHKLQSMVKQFSV